MPKKDTYRRFEIHSRLSATGSICLGVTGYRKATVDAKGNTRTRGRTGMGAGWKKSTMGMETKRNGTKTNRKRNKTEKTERNGKLERMKDGQ